MLKQGFHNVMMLFSDVDIHCVCVCVCLLQTLMSVAVARQCAVTSVRTPWAATDAPVPLDSASLRVAGSAGVSTTITAGKNTYFQGKKI